MPNAAQIKAKERKALKKLMDTGSHKIPLRKIDENLLIATWNIAQFTGRKKVRTIQYIADICERFDLIAIQEVKSDLRGLAKLKSILPGAYDILVSDVSGNTERMAFLYDTRTVQQTGLVCEIGFAGTITSPSAFQFNRMPYCASFKAGRFDFVVVSVHITEGSSSGSAGLALREKEINLLVNEIKKRSKREISKTFDRDFFVVGDFNIQKEGDRFFKALVQGPKPKFSMPAQMDTLGTNFSQSKTFDKIAWLQREDFKFSGKFGAVPFGKALYKQTGESARKEVSDHLPVWAEFSINELTQELDQIIAGN